jgi:hypothetical protein
MFVRLRVPLRVALLRNLAVFASHIDFTPFNFQRYREKVRGKTARTAKL